MKHDYPNRNKQKKLFKTVPQLQKLLGLIQKSTSLLEYINDFDKPNNSYYSSNSRKFDYSCNYINIEIVKFLNNIYNGAYRNSRNKINEEPSFKIVKGYLLSVFNKFKIQVITGCKETQNHIDCKQATCKSFDYLRNRIITLLESQIIRHIDASDNYYQCYQHVPVLLKSIFRINHKSSSFGLSSMTAFVFI